MCYTRGMMSPRKPSDVPNDIPATKESYRSTDSLKCAWWSATVQYSNKTIRCSCSVTTNVSSSTQALLRLWISGTRAGEGAGHGSQGTLGPPYRWPQKESLDLFCPVLAYSWKLWARHILILIQILIQTHIHICICVCIYIYIYIYGRVYVWTGAARDTGRSNSSSTTVLPRTPKILSFLRKLLEFH